MFLIFSLVLFTQKSLALTSCQHNLKYKNWPLDCLIELKVNRTPTTSAFYKNLDKWCFIYSDEILSNKVPEPFFSIYSPPRCYKLAKKARLHQEALELIEGTFLNSFP